jgi:hypothetical protein
VDVRSDPQCDAPPQLRIGLGLSTGKTSALTEPCQRALKTSQRGALENQPF